MDNHYDMQYPPVEYDIIIYLKLRLGIAKSRPLAGWPEKRNKFFQKKVAKTFLFSNICRTIKNQAYIIDLINYKPNYQTMKGYG